MDIYDQEFVESLFNRMSKTYGLANYISSFGFTERWRKQCIEEIDWSENKEHGYDLMSGMGETWNLINSNSQSKHQLVGVDISPAMNAKAKEKMHRYNLLDIDVTQQDVLANDLADNSADYIVSTFGLKTFSSDQLIQLAKQIKRLLKPGGQFSFVEISRPKNKILILPYMFYLKFLIPLIGKLFMGNSMDYRMLGIYCENFKDCSAFMMCLENEGMDVEQTEYFFGCATGVVGRKV